MTYMIYMVVVVVAAAAAAAAVDVAVLVLVDCILKASKLPFKIYIFQSRLTRKYVYLCHSEDTNTKNGTTLSHIITCS